MDALQAARLASLRARQAKEAKAAGIKEDATTVASAPAPMDALQAARLASLEAREPASLSQATVGADSSATKAKASVEVNTGAGDVIAGAGVRRTSSPRLFGADVCARSIESCSPLELCPTETTTMSKKEFKRFVDVIRSEGIQETIKYIEHNGKKYVVDGHHRLRAAAILGLDKILIEKVNLPYKGYHSIDDLYGYFGR
jgi:hypothetical protein